MVQLEQNQNLIDALATLKPADQELLRLITWEEHPRHQVARMLEVSRSTLDQRLHRAVERFRKAYSHLEPTEAPPKAAEGGAR